MLFTQLCVLTCSCCIVVSFSLLYIATVCLVLPCLKRVSGGPELGWVIVCLSVGRVLVGQGGWTYFYGYWSFSKASKNLLGAVLHLSFKWLLMENSL